MLSGPILGALLGLTGGNILFAVGQIAAQGAEAWYVGLLGVEALAAVALAYPMVVLMQMMSAGAMGGAVNGAVARAMGAGNKAEAAGLAIHAIVIALVAATAWVVVMLGFGATVVDLFGASDNVHSLALAYIGIVFVGAPGVWLANTLASVVRGVGAMSFASNAIFVAFAVQIVVGAGLTLGIGPVPSLGLEGAAYGHLLGFGTASMLLAGYLVSGRTGLTFDRETLRLSRARFHTILRIGAPALISPVMSVATVLIATALIARHGADALAGYGLGARLEMIMVPLVFAVGTALTTMVGANVGAGSIERARRVAWTGGLLATAATGLVGLTVWIAPDLWLGLFTADAAARNAGALYFHRTGLTYGFLGFGLAVFFASLGAGLTFRPTVAVVSRTVVVAVAGLALASDGPGGVYLAVAAGMATLGLVNIWGLAHPQWRTRAK